MDQKERRRYLIGYLAKEDLQYRDLKIPEDEQQQKDLLRGLMNVRMPAEADEGFLKVQDEYLKEEIRSRGITDLDDLVPSEEDLYLWKGDITTLRCDAIVNAANSQLCGCFIPCHRCIDNAIHTYAGIQLRKRCYDIMTVQGHEEKTGDAKITPAYNLPCRYVIHTVGPIVYGKLNRQDEGLLRSCYRSCLELAEKHGLSSIAFCCISTGEFHFPNDVAADIAIRTVREFKKETGSRIKVIFNVFKETDYDIYTQLLG